MWIVMMVPVPAVAEFKTALHIHARSMLFPESFTAAKQLSELLLWQVNFTSCPIACEQAGMAHLLCN